MPVQSDPLHQESDQQHCFNGSNRNGNAENPGNEDGTGNDMQMSAETASQLEKDWKEISEKMQIEIEAF